MSTAVREPAVAGMFYPDAPEALRRDVDRCLRGAGAPEPRFERLLLVPHAGYAYSGAIAGEGYARVRVPPLVVVLAPNHHGIGAALALPREGAWRTPLGDVPIDAEASAAIASRSSLFRDDWRAHSKDHALEVHLPFLQVRAEQEGVDLRVVTISVGTHVAGELREAGEALAAGLREHGATRPEDVLLVVSSDMSHYIPAAEARQRDLPALERAAACDPEGLLEDVQRRGTTMCGIAPAVAGITAARELGAGAGELVRYGHSGEVTGDDSEVVAYATLVLAPAT